MKYILKTLFAILLFSFVCTKSILAQGDQSTPNNKSNFNAYNNYDFISGDTILFEDHFIQDMDGEFATHWKLDGGQAVVNTFEDDRVVALTKYYTELSPRIKQVNYLPNDFTIEFDTWLDEKYDSNPGVGMYFNLKNDHAATLEFDRSNVSLWIGSKKIGGELPSNISNENYLNKWHHIAIAVKGNQLKVYCDQFRILVVPEISFKANAISMYGNASEGLAMLFKNFKLAKGGGMNLIGKKFTESKLITHGITFDHNKATIKPESMGVLNSIASLLKENPSVSFEIGGYTDSDGDDAYNLKLSQQRAQHVQDALIKLDIDASRLKAIGYGEQNPIADNATEEGKANNRRVEFVTIKK